MCFISISTNKNTPPTKKINNDYYEDDDDDDDDDNNDDDDDDNDNNPNLHFGLHNCIRRHSVMSVIPLPGHAPSFTVTQLLGVLSLWCYISRMAAVVIINISTYKSNMVCVPDPA